MAKGLCYGNWWLPASVRHVVRRHYIFPSRKKKGEGKYMVNPNGILLCLVSLYEQGLDYSSAAVRLSAVRFFTKLGGIWNILLASYYRRKKKSLEN